MKHVFNSSEVPHIWAAQTQSEGRNSQGNFYFRGQTIYSYGSHFPIATILGNDVLFTLRTYSSTTAGHISAARRAVSHKNIISCYEVPIIASEYIHEKNLSYWQKKIQLLFNELSNKRNRDFVGRMNAINYHIGQLTTYCDFFKIKPKDKELKKLLKIAKSPDFLEQARSERDKADKANAELMDRAAKAYQIYLNLWRNNDTEAIKELDQKTKDLANIYHTKAESFTYLRLNKDRTRLETTKGVEIPVKVAYKAYLALNGCLQSDCKDLSIPVMNYTITEANTNYIKAGCHTIPQSDVLYIAKALNWN